MVGCNKKQTLALAGIITPLMADSCRIRVVCRVRPLNAKEKANGSVNIISFPGQNALAIGVSNCRQAVSTL